MHIDWWLKHGLSTECTMFELLWILRGHITAQAHFNSRKVETFGALNVDTEPCTPLLYHDRTFSLSNFGRRKMKSIQWVFNKTNCIEMRALLNIAKLHMYDTHTNNQINRGKLECMTPCLRIYQENSHLIALSYNSRLPLLQISSLSNRARILFYLVSLQFCAFEHLPCSHLTGWRAVQSKGSSKLLKIRRRHVG